MSREVHVAGVALTFGPYLRQRCAWCGATLIDLDVSQLAFSIPEGKTEEQARADGDFTPATWEITALIAIDGHATYVVDPIPSDTGEGFTVPDDCCMRLDPAVTR